MTAAHTELAFENRFYTWSFPGSPVRVRIDLALVGRMQRQLQESPAAGLGLMVGRAFGPGATEITGFQPVPDLKIGPAIASAKIANPNLSVVGYYRTQQESSLQLQADDLALAQAHFADPHCVFLLIGSIADLPANASFFFWDGGHINGDFAFLEFPFDAALLTAAEERQTLDAKDASAETENPAFAGTAPAPPPPKKTRMLRKTGGWVLLAALSLTGIAIGARRYFDKPVRGSTIPVAKMNAPATGTFSLTAERQGSDLKLSWDRNSPVILSATAGHLSVVEGDTGRQIKLDSKPLRSGSVLEIELDSERLRSGSVLYSPGSNEIRIALTVQTPARQAIKESVMVILPRSGPPRLQAADGHSLQHKQPSWRDMKPPASATTEPAQEPTRSTTPINEPTAIPAVTPEFGATALPLPLVGSPDPPLRNLTSPPIPSPVAPPPADPPKPAVAPMPAAQPPATPQPLSITPPEPVHRVLPAIPQSVRRLITKTLTVQVNVSLDATGKVVKATPIEQKGLSGWLSTTEANAARAWRFRPARRGSVSLPSETRIDFVFQPER
jgi:hypothetical protein